MELHPLVVAITNGDRFLLPFHFKFRRFLLIKTPHFYFSRNFYKSAATISIVAAAGRNNGPWDPNAEGIGSRKFKFGLGDRREGRKSDVEGEKRRWWSDDTEEDEEEEEESRIFDEFIDSMWILKVFKSFGWALPPIILSWLVATGPKAFLMALALPVGQSLLTFAFGKLSGSKKRKPRRRTKKTRKPFVRMQDDFRRDNYEEQGEELQETVKRNKGYQSWVVDDNGYVNREAQDRTYFGGWDELDTLQQPHKKAAQSSKKAAQSRTMPSRNSKLSGIGQKSEVPLLLRLLIAVFPFLASWTKML